MSTITVPERFQAAYSNVLYNIVADSTSSLDVEIYDSGNQNVIAIKRLAGSLAYAVNLTPYLAGQFQIAPLALGETKLVSPVGRIVNSNLKLVPTTGNSITAGPIPHTAGVRNAALLKPLSDAPLLKTLAPGQQDEISFLSNGAVIAAKLRLKDKSGSSFTWDLGSLTSPEITAIRVDANTLISKAITQGITLVEAVLTVTSGQIVLLDCVYKLLRSTYENPRLCWINPYGAVDAYTFFRTDECLRQTDNQKIQTPDGYQTVRTTAVTTYKLVSGILTPPAATWLAQILSAPRVWLSQKDNFLPVDILTDSISLTPLEPARVELFVRIPNSPAQQRF